MKICIVPEAFVGFRGGGGGAAAQGFWRAANFEARKCQNINIIVFNQINFTNMTTALIYVFECRSHSP